MVGAHHAAQFAELEFGRTRNELSWAPTNVDAGPSRLFPRGTRKSVRRPCPSCARRGRGLPRITRLIVRWVLRGVAKDWPTNFHLDLKRVEWPQLRHEYVS